MAVDLGFMAADILGIRLYRKKESIFGADRKSFEVGPWEYSLWLEVNSHIDKEGELGIFVKMTSRVWLYLMLTHKSHKVAVFDAVEAGVNNDVLDCFKGKPIKETLDKLGDAVKKVYEYKQNKWAEVKALVGVAR